MPPDASASTRPRSTLHAAILLALYAVGICLLICVGGGLRTLWEREHPEIDCVVRNDSAFTLKNVVLIAGDPGPSLSSASRVLAERDELGPGEVMRVSHDHWAIGPLCVEFDGPYRRRSIRGLMGLGGSRQQRFRIEPDLSIVPGR